MLSNFNNKLVKKIYMFYLSDFKHFSFYPILIELNGKEDRSKYALFFEDAIR